jgi:hypothetical protein
MNTCNLAAALSKWQLSKEEGDTGEGELNMIKVLHMDVWKVNNELGTRITNKGLERSIEGNSIKAHYMCIWKYYTINMHFKKTQLSSNILCDTPGLKA